MSTAGRLTDPETDKPVSDPTKTIRATVTDTSATPDTATDEVLMDLAPPLAAPTETLPGTMSPLPRICDLFLERCPHHESRLGAIGRPLHSCPRRMSGTGVWEMPGPGIHACRSPPCATPNCTPGALQWSDSHSYATVQRPQNLVVTATHDTVTVRWDKQPHAGSGVVILRGPMLLVDFPSATVPGRETVVLRDLPPSGTKSGRLRNC